MRAFLVAAGCAALLLAGCNPGVREDRSITFGGDGSAGFQHAREGVFVADPAGGSPVCIYKPAAEDVAVSPPLWSAEGTKLIFTTAQATAGPRMPADPHPDGSLYPQRPVTYTCWLRDAPGAEARRLFESRLDHVGYVAANFAVRWDPAGDGVLFLEADGKRHVLRRFDLATGATREIFPRRAEALLFDFTPSGSLCCVLGNRTPGPDDGLWIGRSGDEDWWHVAASSDLPTNGSPIEAARAMRPAWTRDGSKFAFVDHVTNWLGRVTHRLRVGTPAGRSVLTRLEHREGIRNVYWSPDGRTLGYVSGRAELMNFDARSLTRRDNPGAEAYLAGPHGELRLLDAASGPPRVIAKSVVEFAGWDAGGKLLAYVSAPELPHRAGDRWALLLTPNPEARGVIWAADGDGGRPRKLIDGWHATFPRWSPAAPELGLWLTFESPYSFGPASSGALPPGDPAALLGVDGKLRWQPVSAREQAQLAHDRLRRRDPAGAWEIYAKVQDDASVRQMPGFPLFVAHCLTRLGQQAEAEKHLATFRRSTPIPEWLRRVLGSPEMEWWRGFESPPELRTIARDFLAAEVFLSLDEPGEAVSFLRQSVRDAPSGAERCASAVVLGQVLLVLNRRADYLELVAEVLFPGFLKVSASAGEVIDFGKTPVAILTGLTLLPACSDDFLAAMPRDWLQRFAARAEELRPTSRDHLGLLALDAALEASYRRLGDDDRRRAAAKRVEANPARGEFLPNGVDAKIDEMRELRALMTLMGKVLN
jgi:hypothetical protein